MRMETFSDVVFDAKFESGHNVYQHVVERFQPNRFTPNDFDFFECCSAVRIL